MPSTRPEAAAAFWEAGAAGNSMLKAAPPPTAPSTARCAPWAEAMRWTIDRPKPARRPIDGEAGSAQPLDHELGQTVTILDQQQAHSRYLLDDASGCERPRHG